MLDIADLNSHQCFAERTTNNELVIAIDAGVIAFPDNRGLRARQRSHVNEIALDYWVLT